MNKQNPGIEWTHPYGRPGYTWNPVQGCEHDCQWQMPDGSIAVCYAKTIAEKFRSEKFMPDGFEHHYFHPERLQEPGKLKTPAGIFLDSFSDLMGKQVPDEQIQQVLSACADNPQHVFFLLTKNAPRLLKFKFPPNVWVGASMPPDFMYGRAIVSRRVQERMLATTLKVLDEVDVPVRWMSFEPLSWNVAPVVAEAMKHRVLQWAVIGAASKGPKQYPPNEADLRALVDVLDSAGVPIFYKGNLRSSKWAADNWREEYPPDPSKRMILSAEPLPEAAYIVALEDELRKVNSQYADLAAAHADLHEAAQPFHTFYRDLARGCDTGDILHVHKQGMQHYQKITAGDVQHLGRLLNGNGN